MQRRDYIQLAAQDPTPQVRAALRHYGKLIGLKSDVIEQIFPDPINELRAEEENVLIMDQEKAIVLPNNHHYLHLHVHNKLPDSLAKKAHIEAHKKALILQKFRPDLVPEPTAQVLPEQNLEGMQQERTQPRQLPDMTM